MKKLITLLVFFIIQFSAQFSVFAADVNQDKEAVKQQWKLIEESQDESCKKLVLMRNGKYGQEIKDEVQRSKARMALVMNCTNAIMIEKAMEQSMKNKNSYAVGQDAQKTILAKKSELYADPVYAPSGYNVTIVEFFDYNCGYCKRAQSTVENLIAQDQKVRIVFKELPILGPSSIELSKVAIAVNMIAPEKYLSLHNALMKGNARTKDEAVAIVKGLGVDADTLNKILDSKKFEIEAKIKSNRELASSIGIHGTPAFVIGDVLIPGAVELSVLKEIIREKRGQKQ